MPIEILETKKVYINSADRLNGTPSDFSVNISNLIGITDDSEKKVRMSVLKCTIPYSFYSVNELNNKFKVSEYDPDGFGGWTLLGTSTVTFQTGNYNVIEFKKEFLKQMGGLNFTYTIEFERLRHKWKIGIEEVGKKITFDFDITNSLHVELGFDTDHVIDWFGDIESVNVINLSGINEIFVRSSLVQSTAFENRTQQHSNILISIPLTQSHYHLIVYEKFTDYDNMIIPNRIIDNIHLYLTTSDNRPISLNGLEWNIVLQFEVIKVTLNETVDTTQ